LTEARVSVSSPRLAREARVLGALGRLPEPGELRVLVAARGRPRLLGAVERGDRLLVVLLAEKAEAHVVVGQVVHELQAVGPDVQPGLRAQAQRGLEVLHAVTPALPADVLVAGLEVVVVPLADREGRRRHQENEADEDRSRDAGQGYFSNMAAM
jgi:hypothetical protein